VPGLLRQDDVVPLLVGLDLTGLRGKSHENVVVEALAWPPARAMYREMVSLETPVRRLVARMPQPSRTWSRTETTLWAGNRERSMAVPLRSG
jgi:hypothetical protein